jgi:hypothetical protein
MDTNGPALEPMVAGARSLSTYLVLLMLAAALPILAAGIYTVQHVAQSYRDSSLNRMLDITSNLGQAAESDLLNRAGMLQSFAADGDFSSPRTLDRWLRLTGMAAPRPDPSGHGLDGSACVAARAAGTGPGGAAQQCAGFFTAFFPGRPGRSGDGRAPGRCIAPGAGADHTTG